ncbi:hypothetical protein R5R35_007276 [Gryllus longicercus]|uniref:Uncharacterized protein n=1 Tax=Gryllus longicercus TaxID=2509291 RepID=A0AAN9Z7D4_9ORTH
MRDAHFSACAPLRRRRRRLPLFLQGADNSRPEQRRGRGWEWGGGGGRKDVEGAAAEGSPSPPPASVLVAGREPSSAARAAADFADSTFQQDRLSGHFGSPVP